MAALNESDTDPSLPTDGGRGDGDYTPPNPPPYVAPAPTPPAPSPTQGVTDPTVKSPDPSSGNTAANPYGSDNNPNTDYQTTWSAGPNSQPTNPAPAGWHWDASMARYVADAAPTTTSGGGGLKDPSYVDALIASWANKPGANPSLRNDPNYWKQKILSGELGTDEGYITSKFMLPEGAPAGGGASIAGTGSAPGQGGGTGFADPAYQALNALAQARIASLQQPQSFPQLDALMQQLQAQQAVNKQRAAALAGQWGTRVTELQQPLLSQPQVVQQRALASNNLLDSRDAAIANAKANQSARGFAPTSGLASDQARQINENATNQQAQIDARLQQGNISTDESRRNEATQLQGLITQALNGGDATALQEQAQMADLENQLYQTDQQRQTQQLATAQIPVELTNQGFNNAQSSISNPNSALAALMPLIQASLGQQSSQFSQANSQASGLSQILQQLIQQYS